MELTSVQELEVEALSLWNLMYLDQLMGFIQLLEEMEQLSKTVGQEEEKEVMQWFYLLHLKLYIIQNPSE